MCPPSVLRVCHAVDARCNLSPPADSTTPALRPPPLRSTVRSRPATSTTSHLSEPRQSRILHSARHTTATRGLDEPCDHERLSRREECASAHRSLAPESTRPIGRPLRITREHRHARLQHERSRRPDVVAGTREHGYYGDHEWQPGGSLQHFQH